jgi:hypothetical protein
MREVSSIAFSQLLAADGFPRGRGLASDGSMTSVFMAKILVDTGSIP